MLTSIIYTLTYAFEKSVWLVVQNRILFRAKKLAGYSRISLLTILYLFVLYQVELDTIDESLPTSDRRYVTLSINIEHYAHKCKIKKIFQQSHTTVLICKVLQCYIRETKTSILGHTT